MLYNLENITRVHGERTILNIDKLLIVPGKIYTLIGPNGAGKTSLLKILAFLDKPTSGRVYFSDNQVEYTEKRLFPLRRRVVLLDQNPIMFTGSVWRNVEFGLKVRRVPQLQRRQHILEALELVGMKDFADYDAGGLSGGETKRIALARALVFRPEVLLCDEPTANVDNENQEIILKILKRINREEKTSVIFSTHYLSQGQQLADYTLLLQNGVLSDLTNDNIFQVVTSRRCGDEFVCQLTDKLSLALPVTLFPVVTPGAKLHINPVGILFNPPAYDLADGCLLKGNVTKLIQDNGGVRVTVDIGVKLVLFLTTTEYYQQRPCIGDISQVVISYSSVVCVFPK